MRGLGDPRRISILARISQSGIRECTFQVPSEFQRCLLSGILGCEDGRGFGSMRWVDLVSLDGGLPNAKGEGKATEKTLLQHGIEGQRQGNDVAWVESFPWVERWRRLRTKGDVAAGSSSGQQEGENFGFEGGQVLFPLQMGVAREDDAFSSPASSELHGRFQQSSFELEARAVRNGGPSVPPFGLSLSPSASQDAPNSRFPPYRNTNLSNPSIVPGRIPLGHVEESVGNYLSKDDSWKIARPHWTKFSFRNYPPWRQRSLSPLSARSFSASPDFSLGAIADQEKLDPFSLVADEMALLGNKLRSMVSAEVPKLAEAAQYFFKLGVEGKRFRPMVLLLMASSLTAEDSGQNTSSLNQRARQQRIAEITEMIHVASLLHDDVLDHADTRRGIGSLNHLMGNKLAVLAGDFLLARASVALASLHNTEVVELLSMVLEHLVTGEIMQLTSETQEICSMEYYMRKTFYKTASLMANSCKSIAILAEQPREVVNLAFEYGRHLGLAFQLVDDSLDFIGTKASLGKPTLTDLAQGIATAPVLFAIQEHPRIYDLVKRKFTRSGDIDQALEMVQNSQGISKTQQLAAEHAHQAALAIAALPPTSSERVRLCRRALTDLTEQVITRSK